MSGYWINIKTKQRKVTKATITVTKKKHFLNHCSFCTVVHKMCILSSTYYNSMHWGCFIDLVSFSVTILVDYQSPLKVQSPLVIFRKKSLEFFGEDFKDTPLPLLRKFPELGTSQMCLFSSHYYWMHICLHVCMFVYIHTRIEVLDR